MRSVLLLIAIALCNFAHAQTTPNWLWAKSSVSQGGPSSYDFVQGVAADVDGNVYATGVIQSDNITFGTNTFIKAGVADVFLVKYDALGNLIWARRSGGSQADYGYDVAVDVSGYVYITGSFLSPTITFGNITLTQTGGDNMFLVKYDPLGNVVWARCSGSTVAATTRGTDVAIDNAGNPHVVGEFYSPAITLDNLTLTGNGTGTAFVVKYDNNGNVLWAKNTQGAGKTVATQIVNDNTGHMLLAGYSNAQSLGFGSTTVTNFSIGHDFSYLAKLDASGNVLWARNSQGDGTTYVWGAAADAAGNCYITGRLGGYLDNTNFGGITVNNTKKTTSDAYIAKYDPNGNVLWAKNIGGKANDDGYSVAVVSGDVYMLGGYSIGYSTPMSSYDSVTIDNMKFPYPAGGFDPAFLAKFDANGQLLAAGTLKSAGIYQTVISSDNAGGLCIGGGYRVDQFTLGTTTLPLTGNTDAFVGRVVFGTPQPQPFISDGNYQLFPNPLTTSIASIKADKVLTNATVTIYDQQGHKVRETRNISGRQVNISRDDLPAGFYFIHLEQDGKILMTRKWLVAN